MTWAATWAPLVVTACALTSAGAALLTTRRLVIALPILLDLLLAASLLRLAQRPSLPQLGGTALLVLVKRLASFGLRQGAGDPAVPGEEATS